MSETINAEINKREKRAKAIAGMGLVNRVGDHFVVSSPSLRGNKEFTVQRDRSGSVVCDCAVFTSSVKAGEPVRCEHIIAVKIALLEKNTEPEARRAPDTAAEKADEPGTTDSTNEQLTESRESERGEQDEETAPDNAAEVRQPAAKNNGRGRVKDTNGDKKMKRETVKEVPAEEIHQNEEEIRDNVLDFSSTLKELRKNVDPHLVKQREGWRDRNGNVQMVDYVEWHTVADILDDAAPNWTHTVKDIRQIGDLMTVTVAITIDGVTREGIGTGIAQNEMGIKKAEHDALKRAAVKFGIARDLYKKESDAIERAGSPAGTDDDGFPSEPVAKNLGDLVTAKQLGMIRAIARDLNIDPDEECLSVMNCSTDELSKRAASSLITHLQDLQRRPDSNAGNLRKAG